MNFIHHHRTGSQLERAMLLLLYCMFALMSVRGFDWLFPHPVPGYVRFFPTVVLPLAITLFSGALRRRHVGIWLLLAKFSSLDAFVSSLRHLPLTQESMLLREPDLRAYDREAIARHLAAERRMASLSAMRRRVASREGGSYQAAEQLIDILEKHRMTHVGLVAATNSRWMPKCSCALREQANIRFPPPLHAES